MPITLGNTSISGITGDQVIGTRLTLNGSSDDPSVNLNSATGRFPFIRFRENGTGKTEIGFSPSGDQFYINRNVAVGAGGAALRIDSAGRVLMPNQPIISGQMGAAMTSPTAPQKLAFDQFWVSRGITYNSSTRRFTVPVAGIYQITLNPFFNTGAPAGRVMVGVNTDVPTVNDNHFGHAYRGDPSYDTGCMISVVSLSANDYIVYYLALGGLYNQSTDRFNQFSITLIA